MLRHLVQVPALFDALEQQSDLRHGDAGEHHAHARRHHRNHPGDGALPGFAGVEKPLEECRVTRQERVQTKAVGKRAPLLEEERSDEGKQAHGIGVVMAPANQFFRNESKFMSIPAVAPQM